VENSSPAAYLTRKSLNYIYHVCFCTGFARDVGKIL